MMTVGIRELRQNPTEAIRRARHGEVVTITDRGRPVVQMIKAPASQFEQDVAAGMVTRATRPVAALPQPLPPVKPGEKTLTEILLEMRAEERY